MAEEFRLKRTFNGVTENEIGDGLLLQTIITVREIWQAFMKTPVIMLTSNDRVKAMQHYFRHKSDVKYPLAFMFQRSINFDEELGLSAKNLARSGTGHGIRFDNNSATISKSFLIPATVSFEFSVFFDDEYKFYEWQERALMFLASRSLGATQTYKDFIFDIHQRQSVYEISVPEREPDQVPMPNAIEAVVSLTFSCKVGAVKEVAKFNNENHVTRNLSITGSGGNNESVAKDFDHSHDAADGGEDMFPSTSRLSRKSFHQRR